jgi:exopolyphosphatase/guanosine-5'-triphosphate,3'-diphosphate pyrophosphatase
LIESRFREFGWINAVGASGTIRTIEQVLVDEGITEDGITMAGLENLKSRVIEVGSAERINFKGIKADRRNIFAPGLAILYAIFKQLDLEQMTYSEGALREGVLYDQLGRFRHEDVRDRTTRALAMRYYADEEHAGRVATTALQLFDAVANGWQISDRDFREVLSRAARLHEIGLAISHSQNHKHGAYMIKHSDLSGFSRQQQQAMSSLVRCHRRKLALAVFENLTDTWRDACLKMTIILRLAVVLHHSRSDTVLPKLEFSAIGNKLQLNFSADWLSQHPLTESDFKQEIEYLAVAGYQLSVS